jgi:hypothetical protein
MLADPAYTLLDATDGYLEFGRVSAGRDGARVIGDPSGQPQGPGGVGPVDAPPSLPFSVPGCDAPSP